MKNNYLASLKELLDRYQMEENEKSEIINDYNDMYDNWLAQEMSVEQVEEKLGKPSKIISSLTEGYRRVKRKPSKGSKIISISPFISLITFFILGFGFQGWEYAWMVFLLIPVLAIVIEMGKSKDGHMTTALSPFAATIAYFILGYYYNLWHPAWLIFLIIPVIAILNSRKSMNVLALLTSLSPFGAIVAFIYLGETYGAWTPGWLVFLAIPMIGILNEKSILKIFINESLLVIGILGYLYLGYTYEDMWGYAAFSFTPAVLYNMYIGNIQIASGDIPKGYRIAVIVSILAYIVLTLLTKEWTVTWLIFFIIPVYAIIKEVKGNERIISLTPFIATSIFVLLGTYLNIWEWAWLAFLIIPITAILKSE